jgi:hypothetical protein
MATNATYTSAPGYPQSDGGRAEWVGTVTGVNYTAGTPETIEAVGCGMKYIQHITAGLSTSKTYVVVGTATALGATTGGLAWFTASNGSEVTTDVSAETVVLRVIGY